MPSDVRKLELVLDFDKVPLENDVVEYAHKSNFNFCCTPLISPQFKQNVEVLTDSYKVTRSDVILKGKEWNKFVYVKLSNDYTYSAGNEIRQLSKSLLNQEIDWSLYLGTRGIIITLPTSMEDLIMLSQLVSLKLQSKYKPQIIVKITLVSSSDSEDYDQNISDPNNLTWHRWNKFRTFCDTPENLTIALELPEDLPSDEELNRWRGESLKFVILKNALFITNNKGFPVLTRSHKAFVKLIIHRVAVIVSDVAMLKSLHHYSDYLSMMYERYIKSATCLLSEEYEDLLQYPLEPLKDNLECYTYTIFEQDPVKYAKYQEAIFRAIKDKRKDCIDDTTSALIIMVVGAGRGPLVNCSLYAARQANVPIKVYAVEKNPFAIETLLVHREELWQKDDVEIIHSDMRYWNAPQKADILVSELLGSFSDNELSPECLDGVQNHLKSDGISIPKSYTSYVCPIQSPKLYQGVKFFRSKDYFERMFVVHPTTFYTIDAVQEVFTFVHPNKDLKAGNARYCSINFNVKIDCVLHGFFGYFNAILYDDIVIGIVPEKETSGMFSWFPIFIPIVSPILLKKGNRIKFNIWRRVSETSVWYEWCVNEPVKTTVHNLKGRSLTLSLV